MGKACQLALQVFVAASGSSTSLTRAVTKAVRETFPLQSSCCFAAGVTHAAMEYWRSTNTYEETQAARTFRGEKMRPQGLTRDSIETFIFTKQT